MKPLLLATVYLLLGSACFAGRCDDLFRLCDIAEEYSRVEARVVASHRPALTEYSELLLTLRLRVLAVQREQLREYERNPKQKIVVRQGGWSFCRFGDTESAYSRTSELRNLGAYVSEHQTVMKSYDEASTAFSSEILKASIHDWRESHKILKRYIPDLDDE